MHPANNANNAKSCKLGNFYELNLNHRFFCDLNMLYNKRNKLYFENPKKQYARSFYQEKQDLNSKLVQWRLEN